MTPKGAAVLPRPFCRPIFCFPSHPSSRSPCPATFCELLPAPMVTFCELLPVPPAGKVYILPTFACTRSGKVGILSTFGDTLRTLCQPPVNFLPTFTAQMATSCKLFANFCLRPVLAKLAFCQLLATLCALAARLLSPSITISAVFPFFLQTLTLHPRVYESGGGNAKNSPFPLPNIKKAGQTPRRVRADERGLFCFVCAPISALF